VGGSVSRAYLPLLRRGTRELLDGLQELLGLGSLPRLVVGQNLVRVGARPVLDAVGKDDGKRSGVGGGGSHGRNRNGSNATRRRPTGSQMCG